MKRYIKTSISVLFLTILFSVLAMPIVRAEGEATPPNTLDPDEMGVYVIRESKFYGAARRVWLGCNEKVLASIGSGTYAYFKVKSGPNIINIVQAKAPYCFYLLKYMPGETVYLVLDYTSGNFTSVAPYVGETLLKKTKNVPILDKTEGNDGYEFSVINPGHLGIELMKKAEETIQPDSEYAVITFIRPEEFIKNVPFGIWGEEGYLGTLRGHTYFKVKVKPGKHLFITKSEKFSVVEADVEAGKEYYIQFKTKVGMYLANTQLLPVKKETKADTLRKWLDESTEITFDQNSLTDELKTVMDWGKAITGEIFTKANEGKIEVQKLLIEDAR